MGRGTPHQAWYQCLAPADQELGAKALSNAAFDPRAVQFTRPRVLPVGRDRLATESRGETFDRHHRLVRRDVRTGTALLPRYDFIAEPHYKTPQYQEQEYRTALATLRIGERLVRVRTGVHRERVRMLGPPRLPGDTEAGTRAVIERVRRQPIYVPVVPSPPPRPGEYPDAAERLRARVRRV